MADVARLVALGMPAEWARVLGGGTPGEFRFYERVSAPEGWLIANGATIGKPGSGAASADEVYYELFVNRWNAVGNTEAPILDSAGSGSTRGASADADWYALKRMPLPDLRGAPPIGKTAAGTGSASGARAAVLDLKVQKHYHSATGAGAGLTAAGQTLGATSKTITGTVGGVGAETHRHQLKYATGLGGSVSQFTNGNFTAVGNNAGTAIYTELDGQHAHSHSLSADISHTHGTSSVSGSAGCVTGGANGDTTVSLVDASNNAVTAPFYAGLWCVAY